jgi:hypothetical protein
LSLLGIGVLYLLLDEGEDAVIAFVMGGLALLGGVQLLVLTRFANRNAKPS